MPTSDSITSASGIYIITCIPTGKYYVGSAINIKNRWQGHKTDLNKGTHKSRRLQNAWNKYGSDSFEWKILEHVEVARLIEREQHYLDLLDATVKGFNTCPVAGSCLGMKASEETKAKQSNFHRNRTPEHRARLALGQRNRSPETRVKFLEAGHAPEATAKMAATKRGKALAAEHRAKIGAASLGRKHTDEARAKMSLAQRDRSPETRAKLSQALRGKKLTDEHRAKLAEAHRGKKPSAETRAKLSEASRNPSPKTRAKLSQARRGRKFTVETRAKISASQLGKPKRKRPLPGQGDFGF